VWRETDHNPGTHGRKHRCYITVNTLLIKTFDLHVLRLMFTVSYKLDNHGDNGEQ